MNKSKKYIILIALLVLLLLWLLNKPPEGGFADSGVSMGTNSTATDSNASDVLKSLFGSSQTNATPKDTTEEITFSSKDQTNGVSFFGIPSSGTKFVYIADSSGSMTGTRFQKQKQELERSLRALKPEMEFAVIFYDSTPHYHGLRPELLPATKDNIDKIIEWLPRRAHGGGTNPTEAIKQTFALNPDTIWLLTDGVFYNPDEIADLVKNSNNTPKALVHTVALMDQTGKLILERIARENGGQFKYVK